MKKHLFLIAALWSVPLLAQQEVTIRDIQYTTDPSGNSPLEGQTVRFTGVVTAGTDTWVRTINGFFVQDSIGPWHGVYVYTGNLNLTVSRGDSVRVTGQVQEYYTLTEVVISSPSDVEILATNRPLPPPVVVPTAHLATGSPEAEQYEGVLVQVLHVVVTDDNLGFGEWAVDDGSGPCRVDDAAGYSYNPQVGDSILALTGVLYFSFDNFKIEPRGDADILFSVAGSGNLAVSPAVVAQGDLLDRLSFALVGTLPDTLRVLELQIPPDFLWDPVTGGLGLSGPGYMGAQGNFRGSGTPGDPFVIRVEGARVTPEAPGTLQVYALQAPGTPGTYSFEAQTGTATQLAPIVDPPTVRVVSIDGSGVVTWEPFALPIGVPADLAITVTGELGVLTQIEVILPDSGVRWDGAFDLSGSGLIHATGTVIGDTLRIEDAAITPQAPGTVVLRNLFLVGGPGLYALQVRTAGSGGTPRETSDQPLFVGIRPDSTYPLSLFHDPQAQEFLMGRSVRVRGVVTAVLGPRVFLQDSTGGIVLYNPADSYSVGDRVVVLGTYSPFNNLDELTGVVLLSRNPNQPLDTLIIAASQVGESTEGMLVRINGAYTDVPYTLVPENTYAFQDPTGLLILYVDPEAGLSGLTLPADTLDLIGVITQFGDLYQVVPRSVDDLILRGNGGGYARFLPPYAHVGSTEVLLEIRPALRPIRALALTLPPPLALGEIQLIGGGWAGGERRDSLTPEGNLRVELWNISITDPDSIRISFPQALDTLDTLQVLVETSREPYGLLMPILRTPTLYVVLPLAEVQRPGEDGVSSARAGERVTVAGIITAPPSSFSSPGRTSTYLQDETDGVNLFFPGGTLNLAPGDLVVVTGTVTEYNGLTEVVPGSSDDILLLERGMPLPSPETLRVSERLKETHEGKLVTVLSAEVATLPAPAGAGQSFTVWNGLVPVEIYVYSTTGIDLSGLRIGDQVTLTGIGGQYDPNAPYDGGYQLLPRTQEDIQIVSQPLPTDTVGLLATPNIFSPRLGEVLRIEPAGPSTWRYTLRILDSVGRPVRTFYEGRIGPYRVTWRGTDDRDLPVPMGVYIVQLLARDGEGHEQVKNQVIVLAHPR